MRNTGSPQGARTDQQPVLPAEQSALSDRDLLLQFTSLGGSGHGEEFGALQRSLGADVESLLRDADLGHDLLIAALEGRLEGVGAPENTIIFKPDHSDDWWTKDRRYWMAMRSFVKVADADEQTAPAQLCQRLQRLRDRLIGELTSGAKIFVFKNTLRNLTGKELTRLHAAVRQFGPATLFYVRYADAEHPADMVEAAGPGLIIGYIDHFAFTTDNKPAGSVDKAWLALCRNAYRTHHRLPEPEADQAQERAATPVRRNMTVAGKRRIVLIGNCQVNAMAALFKRFVAPRTGDTIEAVASYQDLTDEGLKLIEQADVLVEQNSGRRATGKRSDLGAGPAVHPFRLGCIPVAIRRPAASEERCAAISSGRALWGGGR